MRVLLVDDSEAFRDLLTAVAVRLRHRHRPRRPRDPEACADTGTPQGGARLERGHCGQPVNRLVDGCGRR
jgi:hypothetical protein